MSIDIIRKLNAAGIKCTALTKGILPIELAQLSPENEYGITLVSLDEDFRKEMKSNTAPYQERIKALRALHKCAVYDYDNSNHYAFTLFREGNS